ncbi:hypothetical protein [Actinomadura algeriensis]|uniref:Uncharacterized protein n=1 Tax=Actinomadura algeriensis TaxID=1679523 RepID=A0ABR9JUZ1_9ACTN|nr:hypothetical protein [Actinomadura algeriensis]MBE1534381.1 hypothetical protein [Actinomadura algeriensis]
MDGVHGSEQSSVYHGEGPGTSGGGRPRAFVLVREGLDADDAVVREIVAYGIALPDGGAATVPAEGCSFGRWISPESAARRLDAEVDWG